MNTVSIEKRTTGEPKARMAFVDNIRWTMIAMVVLMHACVTYSGVGSWYFVEEGTRGVVQTLVFLVYQSFSQAFFMGILFFAAALFTPGAYDRKGFGRFLLDRLVRLGVPTLIYMLILHPVTMLIVERGAGHVYSLAQIGAQWLSFVSSGSFVGASGPLWFALALLIFSAAYAVVRLVGDALRRGAAVRERTAPSSRSVSLGAIGLIALIALGTFLVRLAQPIGTNVLNMQLGFFTQYVALFCVGLWAARNRLVVSLPRQTGALWMRLALAIGFPAWFLLGGLGGALSGNEQALMGGLHWQAAAYAAWESFFAVAFSIGLLVLYRERVNVKGRITGLLADTSFGIYVFHAPILVGVTMVMRSLLAWPLAKAALAGAAAWLLALGVAWIVRRIPGVRGLFR